MQPSRPTVALAAFLFTASALAADEPRVLTPTAELDPGPARENSGVVASRRHEDTFWMINDSGDAPRVYAVRRDGSVHGAERGQAAYIAEAESATAATDGYEVPGVLVGGAINVDWEDIALDAAGRLLIPDFGNNSNARRDLVIYVLDEPRPEAGRTTWRQKWHFRYPEQTAFPAPADDFDYDAEALFTVGETAYVLTKHRSDTLTSLYRLTDPQPHVVNDAELLEVFDIGGRVTAADASADGLRLLVLTYDAVWVFERADLEAPFFSGRARRLAIEAEQVEAACFVDRAAEQILIADEAAAVFYELALDELEPLSAAEFARLREVTR
ncbi:MAG: hypothetical protein V2J24_19650 [Pseudomonadales bacterium]|jgi:hypothetical protein|nr:hypothetical protein [Pseudomonadales bacterium]